MTTDANGVARFEGIPAGGRYSLSSVGKKYLQPKLPPFEVNAGGVMRRELVMRESATLETTTVAAPGAKKLSTVRLEVKAIGSAKPRSQLVRGSRPRTGVYPPGRYEVRAQRYVRPGSKDRQPPWSTTHTVELTPRKPIKIEIIVP